MRKIHNFSSFSSLYEAEKADAPIAAKAAGATPGALAGFLKDVKATEASKLYDQT